jgi:hypothetical protein
MRQAEIFSLAGPCHVLGRSKPRKHARMVNSSGILIVDDYTGYYFPGIAGYGFTHAEIFPRFPVGLAPLIQTLVWVFGMVFSYQLCRSQQFGASGGRIVVVFRRAANPGGQAGH